MCTYIVDLAVGGDGRIVAWGDLVKTWDGMLTTGGGPLTTGGGPLTAGRGTLTTGGGMLTIGGALIVGRTSDGDPWSPTSSAPNLLSREAGLGGGLDAVLVAGRIGWIGVSEMEINKHSIVANTNCD